MHDALDAFVEGGSTSAAKVIAGEREVGEPFSRTLREMMAFTHDNPGQIAAAVSVTQVAKYLERTRAITRPTSPWPCSCGWNDVKRRGAVLGARRSKRQGRRKKRSSVFASAAFA